MKITLISPYTTITNIGIRIIAAVLKKEGHEVKLIFTPRSPYGEKIDVRNIIVSEKKTKKYSQTTLELIMDLTKGSDLVCISLNTSFFYHAIEISEKIKNDLNIPIVWGGVHPTIKPAECLKYADFVCRGEGEGVIVELADKLNKKNDYSEIKNLCFKDKMGNFIINPLRPLIQDLDNVPFQSYDLKNQYIILNEKVHNADKLDLNIFFNDPLTNSAYLTYITRGCPMRCTYCYNENYNKLYFGQNIFRKRSVDNIIKELLQAKNILPFVKNIHITDDNFLMLDEKYIEDFVKEYKKCIDLPFVIYGGHPETINREKIKHLAGAGLIGIRMGIQSASEQTKKIYQRYSRNSKIEQACKIINEFKDHIKKVHYDVILDNPWETESDLIETLMFLTKIPLPYILVLFSLTFFPGTRLLERAKKEGIIKDELEKISSSHYWEIKQCYINKLFFLLSDYAISGKRIHPIVMFILTNRFFRKIGLSFLAYHFLRMRAKRLIEMDRTEK